MMTSLRKYLWSWKTRYVISVFHVTLISDVISDYADSLISMCENFQVSNGQLMFE
jgi:hypothetical protein